MSRPVFTRSYFDVLPSCTTETEEQEENKEVKRTSRRRGRILGVTEEAEGGGEKGKKR